MHVVVDAGIWRGFSSQSSLGKAILKNQLYWTTIEDEISQGPHETFAQIRHEEKKTTKPTGQKKIYKHIDVET